MPGGRFSGPGDHSGPISAHFRQFEPRPPTCDLNILTLPQWEFRRLRNCDIGPVEASETSTSCSDKTDVCTCTRRHLSCLIRRHLSCLNSAPGSSWLLEAAMDQKVDKKHRVFVYLSSRPPIPFEMGEGQCHQVSIFTTTSRPQAPRTYPRSPP